ncbi:sodium/proton antiporter, CPA1 family [Williamsia sterculiae]|uniref:Sodium/proton antiporter, CPA1 family n=1 Tax=Williamsia sterculiae TaxID=1344003 RepID=A0A1N7FDF1_9NOCA|nr:sodium/proton antiporter, CPA1 family [Williamsia sterculiae]
MLVLVGAILVTAIADRRGLQPALVIMVFGLAVSFIPGVPHVELDSEILLTVVLPPLLYSAALDFSVPNFIRNIRPILGLGVAMVVITAFVVGWVASFFIAEFTFALALLVGAVAAPPDAVTAVAIGRKLGLPKRVMAILTGESLVNDAAALSLFAIAVSAIAGTHAFIGNPVLLFGYNAILGPVVGAVLGYATLWIRRHLRSPGLETVQGFVVPFAAYLAAENIHASGVLAVVIAGFVVGSGSVHASYQTRLQERYVWNSVDVLLEAFVFAYIGLQMRWVVEDLREARESLLGIAVTSTLVLLVVLLIRPVCVFLMYGRGALFRSVVRRVPRSVAERSSRARVAARAIPRRTRRGPTGWRRRIDRRPLSWQESLVVSWTGMRGVVTLAAASGIPELTGSGEPFPERSAVQAIAFVVAVGTVLIQGSTLPWLISRMHLGSEDDEVTAAAEAAKAEKIVETAANLVIRDFFDDPPLGLSSTTVEYVRGAVARQTSEERPDPAARTARAEAFARLYRDVLATQRRSLIDNRDNGDLGDEATRAMLERLDMQEAGVSARLQSRL